MSAPNSDSDVEITPAAGITIDFGDTVLNVLVAGGGIGVAPPYLAASYVASGRVGADPDPLRSGVLQHHSIMAGKPAHPMAVMTCPSDALRTRKGLGEVDQQPRRDDGREGKVEGHRDASLELVANGDVADRECKKREP